MKKILVTISFLFALTSCFSGSTPATQTGSTTGTTTPTTSTGTAAVPSPVSTGATSTGTAQTPGTDKKENLAVSAKASSPTGATKEPDLNAASEQKMVDDFQKEIDSLLKLMDSNGTK